jgi:glycosyltransferase 2 family protein
MVRSSSRFKTLSRLALLVAGTCLGIVLLVLLLRSVNRDQLGNDFSDVDVRFLLIAIVPFGVNMVLKVPRWGLLYGREQPSWDTLFGAMNVGYAVNSLLPLRLGEIVRAYWVRDRSGISMVRTLSTIALERVIDGVTLIVLLLILAPTVAFPQKILGPAILVGVAFTVALAAMILLAYGSTRDQHPLSRLIGRLEAGRWAPAAGIVRQTMVGLQALGSRRAIGLLALYTFLIWASNSILLWLVLRAFHIEVPITAGILMTAVLNLGMAVPSSPGYVGVYDYLFVLMLDLYGIAKTPALAAGLAMHVIAFVPVTIIGIVYIVRAGFQMTLGMLRSSASQSSQEASYDT